MNIKVRQKVQSTVENAELLLYYNHEDILMYLNRAIEKELNVLRNQFAVITIYGARQVGKTTVVKKLFGGEMNIVSLDDPNIRALANTNPKLFLETYKWPLIIDEIQKATPLLDMIKIIIDETKYQCVVDNKDLPLMYVLTGSNQFELQEAISESLAGRTAVLNMASLSNSEIEKVDGGVFDPHIDVIRYKYEKINKKAIYRTRKEIFIKIFNGGMPEYIVNKINREDFFKSYIITYLEKDIKKVVAVDKERDFLRFLDFMALRTAQLINYDDIARNVGVDARTIKNWISVLVTSGIAVTLESYARNLSDRVTKMEKFYFLDTGLCAYLCKWPNAEMLENGPMSGAFFETYVVSEIIKSIINSGGDFRRYLYYYRDRDNKEVDLIMDYPDGICPIEIKKGINPVSSSFNFRFLEKYKKPVMKGLVIDSRDDLFPINENNWYCPLYMIGV